ncbi:MAG: hypothetical protein HOB45_02620 [Planctomycetaceae bacterium]|nr:hypothetical protein [Planctomycetaceae bacterium]MBT6642009.1 hypothetical protein [Planctomycetaceae bacterium]MBT7728435.1 hypothetical protein [Planctomycetaceae bacterium]
MFTTSGPPYIETLCTQCIGLGANEAIFAQGITKTIEPVVVGSSVENLAPAYGGSVIASAVPTIHLAKEHDELDL